MWPDWPRLELSEAEQEEFTGQLNRILDFVAKLNELDTSGIEPTAHAFPTSNVFRLRPGPTFARP